ncbi:hypothetical protein EST92_01245 [Streptomyces sp. TM32]|nr:hypothetical protein EST92_01245 [Streptomyces sp. TM32]
MRAAGHFTGPGVWDVLPRRTFLYPWRTTEPVRRTSRDAYPEEFRMTRPDPTPGDALAHTTR